MRFARILLIGALAVLLVLAAVIFLAFSDVGSAKEPVIDGMRLRRYVAHAGSAEKELARVGADAIPWLIKGLETEDSRLYKFKIQAWKLLPREWQQKWRKRA